VVLGSNMVGKTALCLRFVNDRFDERYEPTYENSFSKMYNYKGQDIDIVIKDTQGLSDQEIFRNEYGLGYHGYLLVYNVASLHSLEALKSINLKLMNLTGTTNVPRVLVGNKADVADESLRQVTTAQGQALADKWGVPFVECSAKFNHNIESVFKLLLDEIYRATEPDTAVFTFSGNKCVDICCSSLCFSCGADAREDEKRGNASGSSLFGFGSSNRGAFSPRYRSPSPRLEAAARVVVLLTMFCGLGAALTGAVFGIRATGHEAELLGYTLFGFGAVVTVLSVLGLFALRHHSPEFLQVYAVSLTIVLLTQVVVWIILFTNLQLFEAYLLPTAITSGTAGFIEVLTIMLVCCFQSVLVPSLDSPLPPYSHLYE